MFLRANNLYALKPAISQVQNIGFGVDATHTTRGSSLSGKALALDISMLSMMDKKESKRTEKAESWSKFLKLLSEAVPRTIK